LKQPTLQTPIDRLITELAGNLAPVVPVPPLRWHALGLTVCWIAVAAPLSIWPGAQAISNPGFLPAFLTLAVIAVGGGWAALALCIPGRERSARIGFGLCTLGLGGVVLLARNESFPPASLAYLQGSTLWQDWVCIGVATLLALPLWGIMLRVGRRGWVMRPTMVAWMAGVGSVGGGAMLVHTLCAEGCARHALGSHVLAPAWGAILLLVPAWLALRHERDQKLR